MIDVYIVHNNPDIEKEVINIDCSVTPFIHYLDKGSKVEKKKANAMLVDWGAVKTPFVLICEGGKPIKAFYSEVDNVIECLTKYLKEYDQSKCNQCI